jgi:hypothetical protein
MLFTLATCCVYLLSCAVTNPSAHSTLRNTAWIMSLPLHVVLCLCFDVVFERLIL